MVLVSGVTVATNLAVAVIVGVIVSALVFAWNTARSIYVVAEDADTEDGEQPYRRTYTLHGQLFFASVSTFRDLFNPATDPNEVAIDFQYSRVWDHSGMEAIVELALRYNRADRQLHLLHLSQNCQRILEKANVIVDSNQETDPSYRVTVTGVGGAGGGH
jgi:SulP family sulfate permease